LGGIIGALGSAAAVYIMLRAQRNDEIAKVSDAVLSEVAELCKPPIGQLHACAQIQMGQIICPISELKDLFQAPVPIIFPAVASMINRLPRSDLVVTFYMQLQESRGMLAVIEHAFPPNMRVTGQHIQGLADLVTSQCQLANFILKNSPPGDGLSGEKRMHMLKVLDEQLAAAKQVFPNAQSFLDQQLPTGIFRYDSSQQGTKEDR
jgi:hypothetical protein